MRLPGSARELDRRIFLLAIPAVGALAADPLISLVDTLFVARLGTVELAALGINSAIFGFAFILFNFLAYATTPLVAQAIGRGDPLEGNSVVNRALWLAIGLGVVVVVVMQLTAEALVRGMQAGPEVIAPAVSYLRIRALAAPAVLVITASHGAFRGFQEITTPFKVALAANLANALLDPFFMFVAGWGISGAAVASAISQYGAAATFLLLLHRRGVSMRFVVRRWSQFSGLLGAGGVLTLRTLFLVGALAVGTAVAAGAGTTSVAAHQVVRETWFLSAMLVDGLAIAAQAMVAEQIGKGDLRRAREVSDRLVWWGLVVGLVMAAGWVVGGPVLASVFAPDPMVADLILSVTLIAGVMAPMSALVWVGDGVFLGRLSLRLLVVSTAAGALAGIAGFTLTHRFGWGLTGVWWSTMALVAARGVVLGVAYWRIRSRGL